MRASGLTSPPQRLRRDVVRRASSLHGSESQLLRTILTTARREAGLSQVEVAARLSRPQTFVSKYETGDRRVDVPEFVAIAQALQSDPIVLLTRFLALADEGR